MAFMHVLTCRLLFDSLINELTVKSSTAPTSGRETVIYPFVSWVELPTNDCALIGATVAIDFSWQSINRKSR